MTQKSDGSLDPTPEGSSAPYDRARAALEASINIGVMVESDDPALRKIVRGKLSKPKTQRWLASWLAGDSFDKARKPTAVEYGVEVRDSPTSAWRYRFGWFPEVDNTFIPPDPTQAGEVRMRETLRRVKEAGEYFDARLVRREIRLEVIQ